MKRKNKIITVVDAGDYWKVAEWDEPTVDELTFPGLGVSAPIWYRTDGQYQISHLVLKEFASRVCAHGYSVLILADPIYKAH